MEEHRSLEGEKSTRETEGTQVEYQGGSNNLPGTGVVNFLSVITKRRKFISRFVLGATLLMTIVALLLPKWYKATATVFPSSQPDLLLALQGMSGLFQSLTPGGAFSSLAGPSEAERFATILQSETALMDVINYFNLTEVYEITRYPREKTMKELLGNMEITFGNGGEVEIAMYDKDPIRAMMIANYSVDVLNRINADLSVQNARATRAFIEERYTVLLQDIQEAEDSMRAFQEGHGVVAVPQQIEVTISSLADVTAELQMQEVRANVMRRTLGEDHPMYHSTLVEIGELKNKIKEMNTGFPSEEANVLIPLQLAPGMAMEYLRLYRDLQIQNRILEFLTPLYEQAKVDEKRETPSVVVLSYASMPERKSKPKISLYALITFVASTFLSILAVFVWEAVGRLKTLHPERLKWILQTMKSDWLGLRIRKNS